MNSYGIGANDPLNPGISSSSAPEREPTMTDLVSLSDQLAAAVQDVADAWITFQQGKDPRAEIPSQRPDRPVSTYRIDRLHSEMHERIGELQRLANDIRSRS